ncbi:amidase-domain-containing protein [Pleomassaria siparia CBS 279.74]|uniref:Glutamyl-tRNA(Gln) amidotransferase subunit A, mitochondrial n=1 Tax=Pleomassaria siparia CBS 279.74 TaxID=1314801 RepID=A0A6G1KIE0_9PLEO|nr:amidase-domain-containing protein [Pleomassaria siparia CBS 279.74]
MSLLKHAQEHIANQARFTNLNAFVYLGDRALIEATAKAADINPPDETPLAARLSLAGRLIAIKDNICTTEFPTTASSAILKDFKSPYDATVVKQLRDAGAIITGKTNMDEFGMGSHSTHSIFGPVRLSRFPGEIMSAGGSSGGSAAAVASGQCWAALGTDTGGSVRLPAAYTNVVGFKPSYGLLSRWGVIDYANSLDTVGILARDVESVESVFDQLNVYDPQDPTSLPPTKRSQLGFSKKVNTRLTIGIPLDYNITTLDPAVRRAWVQSLHYLQDCGHLLKAVELSTTRHALSAYYILAPAEASSNLAKYDGVRYGKRADGIDGTPSSVLFAKTRGQFLGAEVRRRILLGAFTLSAQAIDNYFIQAQKVRRLVANDFNSVFAEPNPLTADPFDVRGVGVDVLLCPTAPSLTPQLAEAMAQGPLDTYMNDVFTVPASLAGLPAISVPASIAEEDQSPKLRELGIKETAGMQVIGQYGNDGLVLEVARQLLQAVYEKDMYHRSDPSVTAWGTNCADTPGLTKYTKYLKGSKVSYRNIMRLREEKAFPLPKVLKKVKVPGYGILDKYPTSAEKRLRKRYGSKAQELGLTVDEYVAKKAREKRAKVTEEQKVKIAGEKEEKGEDAYEVSEEKSEGQATVDAPHQEK